MIRALKYRRDPPCVDLREQFGDRFRITFDPAYSAKGKHELDPWMMTIAGRRGVIFPHGGDKLAVEVDGFPGTRQALEQLECCRQSQDGNRFGCWIFHVDDFDSVARVIRPHRKRAWTDEQRHEAATRLVASLRTSQECRETPLVLNAGTQSEGAA